MRLSALLYVAIFGLLCIALASCGGSDDDVPDFPTVISLGEGEVFPAIINSSIGVGENRVMWQVTDRDDNPVGAAALHVRYFNLNGDDPAFSSEADARFITTETSFIDENNDRERTVTGEAGVYVTYTTFDEPGRWGAEVAVESGDDREVTTFQFSVMETTVEPALGQPAPPSQQATTATEPIESIDSSNPTRNSMHSMTIADAVASGRPSVIAFATPAYCTSRLCAPILDDVVDPLSSRYGGEANFIHVEPFVLRDLREANARNPVPAVIEWRLQGEPWIFVVNRDGNIAGKFEGIVAVDEVEAVLQLALAAGSEASVTPAPAQ